MSPFISEYRNRGEKYRALALYALSLSVNICKHEYVVCNMYLLVVLFPDVIYI